MLQDCNLVLYNGKQNSIFQSGTANNTMPCSMSVSSANGGSITVSDAYGSPLFVRPTPSTGILASGQNLMQVTPYIYPL